jgi:hypothetical protein
MPLAEVTFYNVVLWVHIVAFLIAFGPTFGYGLFMAAAAKAGPGAMVENVRAMMNWGRVGITTGGVVLLITGNYMAADGPYEFSDFFANWGNIAVLFLLAMTHAYFTPRDRRVIELIESGQGEEAQALGQQSAKVGALMGVVVILTIYVMTAKPFL